MRCLVCGHKMLKNKRRPFHDLCGKRYDDEARKMMLVNCEYLLFSWFYRQQQAKVKNC